MDQELRDLCQEVHRRLGWWYPTTEFHHYYSRVGRNGETSSTWSVTRYFGPEDKAGELLFPLYTSDYLLEKLPFGTSVEKTVLGATAHVERSKEFFFGDGKGRNTNAPLKALLKLTIALDDAGEINHG